MVEKIDDDFKLLVIIVSKKLSRRVVKACKKAGAEGDTVLLGRGIGNHETNTILGTKIEPEKAIILTLVPQSILDKVISKVRAAARLDKPGTGIAFVLKSKITSGIAHKLKNTSETI